MYQLTGTALRTALAARARTLSPADLRARARRLSVAA